MDYIELPDDTPREASFFLAMEEYVAHHANATDCFFTWQVGSSVIFGRNQVAEAEVNLDYCRSRGIATFRRKSGGGCVYADRGNVMMSYITQAGPVGFTYNKYVSLVLLALRRMGIEAAASGRNDIVAGGGKVSGTAFYHLPGRNIVHGTLLYDTDTENMAQALTPPADKLLGKGVRSVRQRIALLKDFTSLSPDGLRAGLRRELCNGSVRLTAADVATIEQMAEEYDVRRRIMVDGFRKLGMDCFEPKGAFYAFPSIKISGLGSEEFCERLLYSQKVALVPGNAFGESGEGFIRASYCYSSEHIKEALERVGKFLKELKDGM